VWRVGELGGDQAAAPVVKVSVPGRKRERAVEKAAVSASRVPLRQAKTGEKVCRQPPTAGNPYSPHRRQPARAHVLDATPATVPAASAPRRAIVEGGLLARRFIHALALMHEVCCLIQAARVVLNISCLFQQSCPVLSVLIVAQETLWEVLLSPSNEGSCLFVMC